MIEKVFVNHLIINYYSNTEAYKISVILGSFPFFLFLHTKVEGENVMVKVWLLIELAKELLEIILFFTKSEKNR